MTEQLVGASVGPESRLADLVGAAGRLLSTLDLDLLLPRLLDLARTTLEADAYALWQRDVSSDRWNLQAVAGLSEEYVRSAQLAIQGNENVVSLDEPIVVRDVAAAEWLTPEHRAAHAAEGTHSFLALPLHHRDEVIGTLVFYYRSPRDFPEQEIDVVSAIAGLAAAALDTASTYAAQARVAEDRRVLVEASEALAASLDYETTLQTLAQIVVPTFADWCVIDLVDEDDGEVHRLAIAHADPEQAHVARELAARMPFDPEAAGVAAVLRTGEPLLMPQIDEAELRARWSNRPEVLEPLLALGLHSSLLVPLAVRGRTIGVISFLSAESRRVYREDDLANALDLARRAATAVDNARLFREAIQNERQVRFLAEAGAALNESLDYDATLQRLAQLVVPAVCDWCIVDVIEGDDVRRVAVAAAADDQQRLLDELKARYPLDRASGQPAAQALRAGHTVIVDELDPAGLARTVVDDDHLRIMAALDPRSAVAIPLVARGETLGAITFAWSRSDRRYRERDLPLLDDLAARASLAVDNARLFGRERAAGERLSFLAEASQTLAASLDYETTLANVAELVVPQYADWCAVDVVDEDGEHIRRLALVHRDPAKLIWAIRSRDTFAPTIGEAEGSGRVIRTGEPVLYRQVTPELLERSAPSNEHARVLRELGLCSAIVVPLRAGGRVLGALTLASCAPDRLYNEEHLEFAQHIGRRAAAAVDNALLYRRAEERAHAARALAFVGDGVLVVDQEGIVRIWNTAASVITGLAEADVVGRRAADAVPGWETIDSHVPLAPGPGRPRVETIPVELYGDERWLSFSGVAFPGGTVYAFRDLTDERRVERLKSEFVSTISHELRTPLAAIYGAALTLRRGERSLEAQRDGLLDVIAGESERLARIVNDILWASRLESGTLHVAVESCDGVALATQVVDSARAHLPANVRLDFEVERGLPQIAADPDKVRQVLTNLVDNAIKYSPDGGTVLVEVKRLGTVVLFAVRDEGLGIPAAEQPRIFDKFYRLDPELTRGVGGTGLGLYISRELVRHMNGRLTVLSKSGEGSTFRVQLPIAH